MFTSRSRFVLGIGLLGLLFQAPSYAQAQNKNAPPDAKEAYQQLLQKAEDEYRILYKRPETVAEFWSGINFEVDVGKFDVAGLLLKKMLEKQPAAETDKELVRIEEVQGLSTFLRLRRVRQWSEHPELEKEAEKNVELLIGRVTGALDRYLGDPERINKFIRALDAPLVEERMYAFVQLNRSGDRAAPFLVEALRSSVGKPLRRKIQNALIDLNPEVVEPLHAVLAARNDRDAGDIDLRGTLLAVIKARGDRRAIAELWQLSALPMYPAPVRERALQTLGYLLQTTPGKLPSARAALVEVAQRYAKHRSRYETPRLSQEERKVFDALHKGQEPAAVWSWGEKGLIRVILPTPTADLYYGLRYARQSLQVDATYRPAQELFVVLSLEQAYDGRLNEVFLKKAPPALQRLLAEVDGALLEDVLNRGLSDGNLPVILGAVQALGERAEARFARQNSSQAGGLVRALYYPDRRVQFAAAQALARLPETPAPAAAARVVEVLRRFLAADPVRKLVFLYVPDARRNEVRKSVQAAGLEPVFASSFKEAFEQLHQAANVDFVAIDYTAGDVELPYFLTQLRGDADIGLLPVLLIAPPERLGREGKSIEVLSRQQFENNLARLADQYRNVWVIPEAAVLSPDALKERLLQFSRYAALPGSESPRGSSPNPRRDHLAAEIKAEFSAPELKVCAVEASRLLLQMARNESAGYDIRPALPAVVHALRVEDTAPQAIEMLGRIPGSEAQQRLASLVLDAKRPKLRLLAAAELNRNVRKYGQLLTQVMPADQLRQLRGLADNPAEDPALRTQVALVLGSMSASPTQTGARLNRYIPDISAPRK